MFLFIFTDLTHWSELSLSSSWVCALGLYISSSSSSSSLSILLLSGRGGVVEGGVREGCGDPTQLTMPGSARPFWAGDSEYTGSKGSIPSSTLFWAGAVWLFLMATVFWESSSPSSSSSAPPSKSSSKEMMLVIFFFLRRSFLSPESAWEKMIKKWTERNLMKWNLVSTFHLSRLAELLTSAYQVFFFPIRPFKSPFIIDDLWFNSTSSSEPKSLAVH